MASLKNEVSEIQEFFSELNVLITGGTGFMGQILIEKLLRSTNVSTIYLIVRKKKGKDMYTRIDEICDDALFDRLKEESPKFKHRIVALAGDCSLAGIGLNATDRSKIVENVNVVFHLAATVNFDEHLKLAYDINVNGTKECLDLCRQIKNLKCFMHVSTVYSNCVNEKIEEKFYDYAVSHEGISMLLNKMSNDEVKNYTNKILGKWPNTYTFTKALAEDLIKKRGHDLPMGIFRPAIVTSTSQEPVSGWINNLYGPTGVCVGVMSGVLRTIHCDETKIADLVPADTCVAGLIASAWDVAKKNSNGICDHIPIYNYVSSSESPITWGEFNSVNYMIGLRYPISKMIWAPTFRTTNTATINQFNRIVYHYLPAILMDLFSIAFGQKPRFINMYSKIHKFSNVLAYFANSEWKVSNTNTKELWKKMNETDKKVFPVSMSQFNWLTYFESYIIGIREYLLKDPPSTLEAAKKRHKRLNILHNLMKSTLYCAIGYVAYSYFSFLQFL